MNITTNDMTFEIGYIGHIILDNGNIAIVVLN